MGKLLFWIAQWTWGLPQNVAGLVWLVLNGKRPRRNFKGAVVTSTNNWPGGVSLGMFIFADDHVLPKGWVDRADEKAGINKLIAHEYGHCIQSLILGPLYLPTVGLTSFIWARSARMQKRRRVRGIDYYDFWCERWANALGERFARWR